VLAYLFERCEIFEPIEVNTPTPVPVQPVTV